MSAIDVHYQDAHVGRVVQGRGCYFFEYTPGFLSEGVDLSPLSLPRRPGVMRFTQDEAPPEGLPGLIADALPDAWGRRVMDAALARLRIEPTPLVRLSYLGDRAMGALSFRPAMDVRGSVALQRTSLVGLERAAQRLAASTKPMPASQALTALLNVGASPGGMEPKALIAFQPTTGRAMADRARLPAGWEHWLVKFAPPGHTEAKRIEHAFALMAREAGIDFPETRVILTRGDDGEERAHFAVRRFDRAGSKRVHMHTAAGLLHKHPAAMDYVSVLSAAKVLTQRHDAVLAILHRLVFCLLAEVRDDHGRNHAFLFDGCEWMLSPAYDYVPGGSGERGMAVCGETVAPTVADVVELAKRNGATARDVDRFVEQTAVALSRWPEIAAEAGVSPAETIRISKSLAVAGRRFRRRA
jgi:serine/threonine-protein kinase HipA